MRLWSLHPHYLDPVGLVALWREALVAQKVLRGQTAAYKNHPQLERFKEHPRPRQAIAAYLKGVWEEAKRRGYHFDLKRIQSKSARKKILITEGQLSYEFRWLCSKLKKRSPERYRRIALTKKIRPHPFFRVVKGAVATWERPKL